MTPAILSLESLLVIVVLIAAHDSMKPTPPPTPNAFSTESEHMTDACDQAGGEWGACTLKEMERVLLK